MLLEPLRTAEDGTVPGPLLAELTALHASNRDFYALSDDFPDANDIRPEQVAAALAMELANPDVEILLARQGTEDGDGPAPRRLVGVAITLARHPDPADPDPWIGLLLVDGSTQRRGYGGQLAALVEERFRRAGRAAVRLAALDNNPGALSFWTSLGYEFVEHRRDRQLGRPCTVLRKALSEPPSGRPSEPPSERPSERPSEPPRRSRRAARIAVLDPEGAVFLFRCVDDETGPHWALPGGGLEEGESPREGALRELREETGWTDMEPGAFLCSWEHDFTRAGIPVRQYDDIYVARGPRREPAGGLLTTTRAEEGILAWRWWTPADLADPAAEPVWPPELPRLLAELGTAADAGDPDAGDRPPAPADVSGTGPA
ncbi:GNAT family N-acetyltransferase [Streptomyces sp. 11x1]|uniref:GNAT family N-acetyltransferase n=1 Tax=Streptomyces sp. 11x1 TaxID=3038642 RepID=UPI0037D9AE12